MPIATNSIAATAVAAAKATPIAIAAGTPIPTAIPTPIPTPTPVPLPTPTAIFSGFQQATVARLQSAGGSEYIARIYATFADWLGSLGVPDPWPAFISALCSLLILATVAYGVFRLTAKLIPFLITKILSHWSEDWARVFQEEKVLDRLRARARPDRGPHKLPLVSPPRFLVVSPPLWAPAVGAHPHLSAPRRGGCGPRVGHCRQPAALRALPRRLPRPRPLGTSTTPLLEA